MNDSLPIRFYVRYDPAAVYNCKWKNCHSTYDTQLELIQHLEKEHVGFKSSNNLCLSCHWDGCTKKYLKRDHITSHIKVHIPFKPHNCQFCQKSFKRLQDLKKHELRIHLNTTELNSRSPYLISKYKFHSKPAVCSQPIVFSQSFRETNLLPGYRHSPLFFGYSQAAPASTSTTPLTSPSKTSV